MNWGIHVKQLRERAGLTQQELARKSGVKRAHISNIERGVYKTYKPEVIDRLAYGLGENIRDLIDYMYRDSKYSQGERPRQETPEQILEKLRLVHPVTVPIFEEFSLHAGRPVEPLDYTPVVRDTAKGRNLEGYIVHGNCLEPDIKDGDVIIIDRDGQIDGGNIVACLLHDARHIHIARLRKIADETYLENNDGRFKLEECQIAAPVIEVRRRLK